MLKYIMKNKVGTIIFIFLLLCTGILSNLFGFVMSDLVDCAGKSMEVIINTLLASILFVIVYILLEVLFQFMKNYFVTDIRRKIKNALFEKIILKNKEQYEERSSAEYISNLTSNIDLFEATYIKNIIYLLELIVSFVTAAVLCLYIEPWMLVIMLVLAVLTTIVTKVTTKPMEKSAYQLTEKIEEYTAEIKDDFCGYDVINAFSVAGKIINKHYQKNLILERAKQKTENCKILCLYMGQAVGLLSTVLVMAASAYFVYKGKISVGMIIAFGHLIGNIVAPITEISSVMANFYAARPLKEKFKAIILEKEDKRKTNTEIPNGDICVSELSFKYDSKHILNKCNITFKRNRSYVLLGNSGDGKSTFLNLLAGIYQNYSGCIKIGNLDIMECSRESLSKEILYVGQDIFLFNDTIKNNITLFSDEFSEEEIWDAVKNSGLEKLIDGLQDGLETKVSENGNNFSGGEKQRIGLARAILRKGGILLLDEYTSNQNKEMADEIEQYILNRKNKTVIVVTHQKQKEKLEKYDVVLELKNGKISEVKQNEI